MQLVCHVSFYSFSIAHFTQLQQFKLDVKALLGN